MQHLPACVIERSVRSAGRTEVLNVEVALNRRDYPDIANACQAIALILRQHGERATDLDAGECESCDEPLDLVICSQCGVDAFGRSCDHGDPRPIRMIEGARTCRPWRPPGPD